MTHSIKSAIKPFPPETLADLFKAVLDHDIVDLTAELPGPVHLDYTQDQIIQGYRLSRQLWKDGVEREIIFLRGYIGKIYRKKPVSAEEQLAYKNIRAKMKHLRCACAIFDTRHSYPMFLNRMIIIMGRLQDRIKNDLDSGKGFYALYFRLLLSKLPFGRVSQEIESFEPSSPEGLQAYMTEEINHIRTPLGHDKITNRDFHEMRKVISRQVAFYDCMKVLYPSPYHRDVSVFLGTIYTLMGRMHDEIVIQNLHDTKDHYADMMELPADVKTRLTDFVSCRT